LHFIHIFFSLKLLIFGDRMGTTENNPGILLVAVNFGSPIGAAENWLFSAARDDRQNKPFSANFFGGQKPPKIAYFRR
jgi:hypothetical protein